MHRRDITDTVLTMDRQEALCLKRQVEELFIDSGTSPYYGCFDLSVVAERYPLMHELYAKLLEV